VLNFLYSVPQLAGVVPCPRHRLPVFDPATGTLRPKTRPDWNLVNAALQARAARRAAGWRLVCWLVACAACLALAPAARTTTTPTRTTTTPR
jgi:UDP-N-acetylglucosamine--dolichyl-phosphate N-acetylglucosaminephosphotransferase